MKIYDGILFLMPAVFYYSSIAKHTNKFDKKPRNSKFPFTACVQCFCMIGHSENIGF